ncbi:MAG: YqgE/AlgH family protein [Bacteroidales bacterium]
MKDIHDLLKIKTNNIKPARGTILISEPFLWDYFFKRSVILLAEHNEDGTFGVIVNKPIKARFNEVVKDFPTFNAKVFLGGPVQSDSLFFIHTLGDQIVNSMEIMPGVYWGGDIEQVRELIQIGILKPSQIRFFIGYSGWSPNQLDSELERNSWVVSHIGVEELLKTTPSALWARSLRRLGKDYAHWIKFPDDPGEN